MNEYEVYVPIHQSGPGEGADRWSWLEALLKEQFGGYTQRVGYHEGTWNGAGASFQGKLRAYSVHAEADDARRFFKRL
jgi:hypothetical protein